MNIIPRGVTTLLLALLAGTCVHAQSLPMLLNPVQAPKQVIATFKPLTDYLSKTSGVSIEAACETNFLSNWQRLLRNQGPLLMIQPPHITAYMQERRGFQPLAVVGGRLSFSIVTGADDLVLENNELIGKRLATTVAPSLGGIVANRMFVDPIRRPVVVEAATVNEAVKMVQDGKAFAAAIPTPLVSQFDNVNIVTTTEQLPLIAISASPQVPADVRDKIRDALLKPGNAAALQAALEKVNLTAGFVAVNPGDFDGMSKMLQGTYGYQPN